MRCAESRVIERTHPLASGGRDLDHMARCLVALVQSPVLWNDRSVSPEDQGPVLTRRQAVGPHHLALLVDFNSTVLSRL